MSNLPLLASDAPVDFKQIVTEIESAMTPANVGWCSLEKATTLAAIITGLRPKVVVELGVWMGGSAIPMAIALHAVGKGQLVAIDAWSTEASVSGQEAETHATYLICFHGS
jgi:predicted O-methyltransferase YrrM